MEGATYEQLTTDLVVLVPAHDEVKGRESREDGYGGRRRRLDRMEGGTSRPGATIVSVCDGRVRQDRRRMHRKRATTFSQRGVSDYASRGSEGEAAAQHSGERG